MLSIPESISNDGEASQRLLHFQSISYGLYLVVFFIPWCVLFSSGCVQPATPPGDSINESFDELDPAHELDDDEAQDMSASELAGNISSLKKRQLKQRIAASAIIGGGLLSLLTVLFVYLRLEHFTRGFYSARIQTISGIVSVAVIGICYFLWRTWIE